MRSKSLVLCLLMVGFAPWACDTDDDNTIATSSGGAPCEREADCEDSNPCSGAFCDVVDGVCKNTVIKSGQQEPAAEDTAGDCQFDGCVDGAAAVVFDDNDTPDDGNQDDCLVWQCLDGVADQVPRDVGDRCDFAGQGGVCDAAGVCSCAVSAGEEAWVDPVDGTDAPAQGGRRGSCSFKTLTYALTQFTGVIRLVQADYSANTGETLPFVLTGGQQLECFDFNTDTASTLTGNGTYGGGTATVALEGTDNDMDDCIIVAGGADHGIIITADGSAADHDLRDLNISGAVNGITQTATGVGLDLRNSTISNNSGVGVSYEATMAEGNMEDNTFSGNGTDVQCVDVSPQVDGQNNAITSCSVCENCNF
jgi:hypothetical protein